MDYDAAYHQEQDRKFRMLADDADKFRVNIQKNSDNIAQIKSEVRMIFIMQLVILLIALPQTLPYVSILIKGLI